MSDETTQPQGTTAPVETEAAPAAPAQPAIPAPVDVESIVTSRLREWEEKRITPLQTMLNEKNEEIKKLKTASLSDEERGQLAIEDQERERQSFETERWLFQKAKENGAVASVLEKFLALDDPDEQWNVLVQAMTPASPPAPASEPDESTQVPDIDPNNPAPTPSDYQTMPDGSPISRTLAEEFLKKLTSWPQR